MTTSTESHRDLSKLPKAELHIHLEGAMRRETLVSLCNKYSIKVPSDTREKRFDNFAAFADVYIAACECIRTESDLHRLVLEVAEDAAASGARWIEPALSISFYSERFGGTEATLRLLVKAAEVAEKTTGVGIGFVVAAERMLPPSDAEHLAAIACKCATDEEMRICDRPAIIGFGLHGPEEGFPPAPFAKAFEIACNGTGIVSVPHAGEIAPYPGQGAKSVEDAVTFLKAKRIAHGVLASNDDAVLNLLVRDDACLDVCPTSNYLLRVVESIKSHPLPTLCRKGIPCTINSDDPLLFGCNLMQDYTLCREALNMYDEEIANCARNSFRYSCAPAAVIAKGLADIDNWCASK